MEDGYYVEGFVLFLLLALSSNGSGRELGCGANDG